jgi:hypothetical protein
MGFSEPSDPGSGCGFGSPFQQIRNTVGGLRTLGDPVIDAIAIDPQRLLATGGNRIEETEALDVTAITWITAVGHDDVVEGPLFCASSGKTNGYHLFTLP